MNSLAFHSLGLGALTPEAEAQPLAWEPRPHKPCGTAKKERRKQKKTNKTQDK